MVLVLIFVSLLAFWGLFTWALIYYTNRDLFKTPFDVFKRTKG